MRPDSALPFPAAAVVAPPTRAPGDFELLVLPHRAAAYNLARWLLRHDQDAEDCVQESFYRAYRAFGQFRGEDAKGWLLAIVRNTCYLLIRQRRRAGFTAQFDEVIHSQSEEASAPEASEHDSLAQQLLPQALDRLPPQTRTIIVLREIEGRPYKDIKVLLGIPIGTVMSRLSRARSKLQQEVRGLLRQTPVFDYGTAGR